MGSRYLVTGVQLGILKGVLKDNKITTPLIDEICEKQFVGMSENEIVSDVDRLQKSSELTD